MEYQGDVPVYLMAIQLHFAVSFFDQPLQLVCLRLLLRLCFNQWNLLLIFIQVKDFSV
jgi:hypothetical protein